MAPSPKLDMTSSFLLLALALVWGGSFFFAEIALTQIPPLSITLHRVFWAVPALYFVVRWKGLSIPRAPKIWLCYLVMGALNNAIPFSLIFWGQASIGSGLASILNATTAFFGVLVAGIFLRDEPLTPRKIAGALVGVLGVATIMGLDVLTDFSLQSLAQLAILGAALSYAFAGVWGKRTLSGLPPVMNAFGMLVGSTILMIPIALMSDGPPNLALPPTIWAALIALAVLSTSLAYLLYFAILARAGSANLMLVTLLIPPVALTLSTTILGETISRDALSGFGLIAAGLLITDGRLLNALASMRHRPK